MNLRIASSCDSARKLSCYSYVMIMTCSPQPDRDVSCTANFFQWIFYEKMSFLRPFYGLICLSAMNPCIIHFSMCKLCDFHFHQEIEILHIVYTPIRLWEYYAFVFLYFLLTFCALSRAQTGCLC